MNKTCPECGKPLNENDVNCPECGYPLQNQQPDYTYVEDEGDNDAEEVLRTSLSFFKKLLIVLSIIYGIFGLIAGIMLTINGIPTGIFLIILSVLGVFIGIAIAKLVWATGMIFINISTNVRKVKQLIKIRR